VKPVVKIPLFIPSSDFPKGFPRPEEGLTHPNGVHHSLNSHGFRSQEFSDRGQYHVLAVGCSYAFGWCLPQEHIWLEIFCDLLSAPGKKVIRWNLSLPGASNDYIARTLMAVVPKLRPDLVLVSFSQPARTEYWLSYDEVLSIRPTKVFPANWSPLQRRITKKFNSLQNEWNDQSRLYNTYRLVESFLGLSSIHWLYTFACVQQEPFIAAHLDRERFVGDIFRKVDLADDARHPGVESNRRLAHLTWEAFKKHKIAHTALTHNQPPQKH
jgi:hypothetical protein